MTKLANLVGKTAIITGSSEGYVNLLFIASNFYNPASLESVLPSLNVSESKVLTLSSVAGRNRI